MANTVNEKVLGSIYKDTDKAKERYSHLMKGYVDTFGDAQLTYFTSPGRTEIIGNHTDHNGGKVIAASIDLDTLGAASVSNDNIIEIQSEGYRMVKVDLDNIDSIPKESGTISLVAGMAEGVKKMGYAIGGFKAYATTNVIAAAGISSSASFEMLFVAIVNKFFNDGKIPYSDYAKIGQYAENHFWNKASGLMDQMACAVGGPISLDFAGEISCDKIPFSFDEYGYRLVITNTGGGHADLSDEYSAVPEEMFAVAKELGVQRLCETNMEALLSNINSIRAAVKNDRAILRAMHFLNETRRVEKMADAVAAKDIKAILSLLSASGASSYDLLQNCYSRKTPDDQPIALALALTEQYLSKIQDGVCRVHGGGFAGVIMAIIPENYVDEYVDYMSVYFGRDNVYPMNIRAVGAVCVE
ncbi:MAG: galactokinase [Lachnospiraceae bacterium]|nr:galactokinase [Lachnospiraceae bacterium]